MSTMIGKLCATCFLWSRAALVNTPSFSFSSTSLTSSPVVELREYELKPEYAVDYIRATAETIDLRMQYTPLRSFSLPETGGQLQMATHFYYYQGGHKERDAQRTALSESGEWKSYITKTSPFCSRQSSSIFVEAPAIAKMDGVGGLSNVPGDDGSLPGNNRILELRRYKLKLGYDTVPEFLGLYSCGLPSKLQAPGTDPSTALISVLYNECGQLNEVIELWRHGDGTSAMEKSRVAGRAAPEWRTSIARIAELALEFTSTIHKPTSFSPLK